MVSTAATLYFFILEMPGRDNGLSSLQFVGARPQCHHENSEIIPRLGNDFFRPNSFQFINQSLNYWERRKINISSSSSRLTHWHLCLTPPTLRQRTKSEWFESAQGSVGLKGTHAIYSISTNIKSFLRWCIGLTFRPPGGTNSRGSACTKQLVKSHRKTEQSSCMTHCTGSQQSASTRYVPN